MHEVYERRLARALGRFERAISSVRDVANAAWAEAILEDGRDRAGARLVDVARIAYTLDIAAAVLGTVPGAVTGLMATMEEDFGADDPESAGSLEEKESSR